MIYVKRIFNRIEMCFKLTFKLSINPTRAMAVRLVWVLPKYRAI